MAKVRKQTLKLQLSSTYGRQRVAPNTPLTPEQRLERGRIAFFFSNTGGDWDTLSEEEKKRWADKGSMNHDFGKRLATNAAFGKFGETWDKVKGMFYEGGRFEEPPMFPPVPEAKQVIEYDFVSAYPKPKKLPTILA